MRKLGLILATTALFGLTAPAFAIEASTGAKVRTPAAQANVQAKAQAKTHAKTNAKANAKTNAGVKSKTTVHARHESRGVNKTVQHDRGLHRGFTHSRHYGYAKNHSQSVNAKAHVAKKHRKVATTVGAAAR